MTCACDENLWYNIDSECKVFIIRCRFDVCRPSRALGCNCHLSLMVDIFSRAASFAYVMREEVLVPFALGSGKELSASSMCKPFIQSCCILFVIPIHLIQ